MQEEGYNLKTMSSLTKFSLNKIVWIVLNSKTYCINHTLPDILLKPGFFFILENRPQNSKNAKKWIKKMKNFKSRQNYIPLRFSKNFSFLILELLLENTI